jgi:hypothetical protein
MRASPGERSKAMVIATFYCDQCAEAGRRSLADYALLAPEESLCGQPGGEPLGFLRWHTLCQDHHRRLSDDARTAYVPVEPRRGHRF